MDSNGLADMRTIRFGRRELGILLLSLFLLLGAYSCRSAATPDALPPGLPDAGAGTASPGLRLLHSGADGITLELTPPQVQIESLTADGQTHDRPTLPGYDLTDTPGSRELPLQPVMLGIPPTAHLNLAILADAAVDLPGRHRVRLVPTPTPGPLILLHDFEARAAPPEQVSGLDLSPNLDPPTPVRIVSGGYIRDQRFVQLALFPLQYAPETGQLRFHQHLTVRLNFAYDGPPDVPPDVPEFNSGTSGDPFEGVLRHTLLNYDSARLWRSRPAPAIVPEFNSGTIALPNPPASQDSWRIVTGAAGIYRLTHTDLQAAGVPVTSLDARPLKVYHDGAEVPIQVTGEDDGRLDSGDQVLFYAAPYRTRYADTNVYWLTYGGPPGQRMAARDVAPGGSLPGPAYFTTTLHLEEDHRYTPQFPTTQGGDHWYWTYLYPPAIASATFTPTLSSLAPAADGCRQRSAVFGTTADASRNPDHHLRISLNGTLVDDALWDGATDRWGDVAISCALLSTGANVIRVESPNDTGATDIVGVQWFEIDYPRPFTADGDRLNFGYGQAGDWEFQIGGFSGSDLEAYDVTDPQAPVQLINPAIEPGSSSDLRFHDTVSGPQAYLAQRTARRLAPLAITHDTPSDWRSPAHGADYVVITHASFRAALQPLVAHRAAQGRRTVVVDVQDVYDEFSSGHPEAGAIHDFLEYAYLNWQSPAPSFVLLVGDGHYDFKDHLGTGQPVFIPPYLWHVDPYLGETASDNRYVTVAGDDIVPDMAIGRLPVQTPGQATTLVDKILAYESAPRAEDWNRRLVFVADNSYAPDGSPDSAGDFWALSDDVALNHVPPPFVADRIYFDPSPRYAGEPYKYTTPDAVRSALVKAIDDGALIVNYLGHAAIDLWAHEELFRFDEVDALSNARLPVMLPMTCYEGSFHLPEFQSLAERLLLRDGRGAIASFSADGLGVAVGHDFLDRGFLDALFEEGIRQMGPAAWRAKMNLYTHSNGAYLDLMDTYNLLGDPALEVALWEPDYDGSGVVDAGDIGAVASRWRQSWGLPYDVDGDGWVTIADIMWVAARVGE